jgi:hypothetical protein
VSTWTPFLVHLNVNSSANSAGEARVYGRPKDQDGTRRNGKTGKRGSRKLFAYGRTCSFPNCSSIN